ncbi:MAG: hypothetical protein LUE94_14670 [Clostridiales bacterium]|nr:hypothetical protein [Clostridiales bacterium]
MKLMTLNTHSLEEENYEAKLHAFAEGVCRAEPDIIALQEVNQTQIAAPVDKKIWNYMGMCHVLLVLHMPLMRNVRPSPNAAFIPPPSPARITMHTAQPGFARSTAGPTIGPGLGLRPDTVNTMRAWPS